LIFITISVQDSEWKDIRLPSVAVNRLAKHIKNSTCNQGNLARHYARCARATCAPSFSRSEGSWSSKNKFARSIHISRRAFRTTAIDRLSKWTKDKIRAGTGGREKKQRRKDPICAC